MSIRHFARTNFFTKWYPFTCSHIDIGINLDIRLIWRNIVSTMVPIIPIRYITIKVIRQPGQLCSRSNVKGISVTAMRTTTWLLLRYSVPDVEVLSPCPLHNRAQ